MMFKPGMLPPMRKPFTTIDEVDALHSKHGAELDVACAKYEVQRLPHESDGALADRTTDVIRIRRYSHAPPSMSTPTLLMPPDSDAALTLRAPPIVPPQVLHSLDALRAFRDDVFIAMKLRRWDLLERAIASIPEIE